MFGISCIWYGWQHGDCVLWRSQCVEHFAANGTYGFLEIFGQSQSRTWSCYICEILWCFQVLWRNNQEGILITSCFLFNEATNPVFLSVVLCFSSKNASSFLYQLTTCTTEKSIVVVEELHIFSFMEHLPYKELLQYCCQSCILLFLSTSSSLPPVSSATTTLLFSTLELMLTFHSQIFYLNHHSKSGSFCFNLYDCLNYWRGIAEQQQWVTDQNGTIALWQWVPNQLVSTLFQPLKFDWLVY